jgi:hypothetical protein
MYAVSGELCMEVGMPARGPCSDRRTIEELKCRQMGRVRSQVDALLMAQY